MPLLQVDQITKTFRGLRAVAGATFDVPEGSIVALIGPNGAGKTTIFNLIAGVHRPDSGQIHLGSRRLSELRPDQICAAGVGRTFQLVKPFAGMSVLENVVVGALHRESTVKAARRRASEALERLGLGGLAERPASSLTLAERRRLEVARALATKPSLLLLDEMMAGLRPAEVDEMVRVLRQIRSDQHISLLLTEHVMRAVMALAEKVVVLHHGEIVACGAPAAVVADPAVIHCYLGQEGAA